MDREPLGKEEPSSDRDPGEGTFTEVESENNNYKQNISRRILSGTEHNYVTSTNIELVCFL